MKELLPTVRQTAFIFSRRSKAWFCYENLQKQNPPKRFKFRENETLEIFKGRKKEI